MRHVSERLRFPPDGGRSTARPVDVVALLDERLADLVRVLPSVVTVETDFGAREARVLGDPAEIDRLIANLVAHLEAMPGEAAGRVVVATALGNDREGAIGHFRISVEDRRGAPVPVRERGEAPGLVHPRGARVEALALTLVRTIADGLGGWVRVGRSESGHQLVEIFLPLLPLRVDNVVNLEEVARWRTHVG
jgi:hypothetical protein